MNRRKLARDDDPIGRFTFPNDEDTVAHLPERGSGALIALYVVHELLAPEGAVALGRRRSDAACVAVPEATVDENYEAPGTVGEVGRAGKVAVVQGVPQAE